MATPREPLGGDEPPNSKSVRRRLMEFCHHAVEVGNLVGDGTLELTAALDILEADLAEIARGQSGSAPEGRS